MSETIRDVFDVLYGLRAAINKLENVDCQHKYLDVSVAGSPSEYLVLAAVGAVDKVTETLKAALRRHRTECLAWLTAEDKWHA